MSPELVGWPQIYCTLSFWRKIVCMWSVARSLRPNLPLMLRPIYNIHSSSTSVQPPLPRSLAPTPLLQKRCIHSGPDGSVFPSPSLFSLSLPSVTRASSCRLCVFTLFFGLATGLHAQDYRRPCLSSPPAPSSFRRWLLDYGGNGCEAVFLGLFGFTGFSKSLELSGTVDTKRTWITLCSDAFGARTPHPKPCTRRSPSPPWPCTVAPTTSPTPTSQDPRRPAATLGRRAASEDLITGFTPLRSIHTSRSISPPGTSRRCRRSTASASISVCRTMTLRLQNCVERVHRACARVTQRSLVVTLLGCHVCLENTGDRTCPLLSRRDAIAKERVTAQVWFFFFVCVCVLMHTV